MTSIGNWITHRMTVLEIDGPTALAEHADLAESTLAAMIQSNGLGTLQQSQRRRLAWALQVNLKSLNDLASGEIEWIDDAKRYLAFSFEPAQKVATVRRQDSVRGAGIAIEGTSDRQAANGDPTRSRDAGDNVNAHAGNSERVTAVVGSWAAPQGTPVLGRVGWDGRIESDDCWDEQWGRRLADGQPQRRDTYALEMPRIGDAGRFVVVRNANPWEATAGTWVAVYLGDDSDGVGYFGHLTRCVPGAWGLLPGLPGQQNGAGLITIDPERALRIGRLVREWCSRDQ